ncbi:hypothetical protein H1P_340037 [Hyella patelloides LEGE 07179]|uniref:Uncharacterized protein n=1 Tax=Hyella patelloides LEGE 07179 TaxID=945734 RepID=A0A563VVS9_9CYAN|nr:hypothetical protein H1P_340037 [Hyella patelloides LEGE 07179]
MLKKGDRNLALPNKRKLVKVIRRSRKCQPKADLNSENS